MRKPAIIAVTLLAVIVLGWLVVSRMPFGGTGDRPVQSAEVETIAEGKSERGSDTLATNPELEDEAPPPAPTTNASTARSTPPPAETAEPAQPAEREVTEAQAIAVLRGFIASHDEYLVRAECLRISSLGYRNVGYTLEVYDNCAAPGQPRSRWRVDSKTREVFVQRADGRYLRP